MSSDEILILGGGPAGCTAARLLASWGHAVRLVTRPRAAAPGPALAESLTPSCGKFFDLLGMRAAIDAAGFMRAAGNTVWWGSTEPRVEPFAGGARGWQVTAPALEAVMLRAAVEAGVRVETRGATAEDAMERPACWRVDCTGRAGLLARSCAGRVIEPGHRTVALSAVWRRADGWPVPDPSHTLVESYADGWTWSVPLDRERRAVAVMVDPRTSTLARGKGARATYLAEVAKTAAIRRLVAGAVLDEGPAGWDASMYRSTCYAGEGWLVAGDAASFVDPLSSSGVKKALASGWLAALVVHTAKTRPALAETARRFFAEREAEMYRGFLALTRRYLGEAAEGQVHPFWADRLELPDVPTSDDAAERARVEAVWERLRTASSVRWTLSEGVHVEARPAIAGREIVLEPRVVARDAPAGVRYLYDVDVVTLVELAPLHRDVPTLYDACRARSGPTDLRAFATALATAVARGWLRMEVLEVVDAGPSS